HLSRRTLALLCEAEDPTSISEIDQAIIRTAALLHDLGHYPFSHALEEIGAMHHEEVARSIISGGPIGALLARHLGDGAASRIVALVRGESDSPLQRLISGSLDLD